MRFSNGVTPLHLYSTYSLLGSTAAVPDLIGRAQAEQLAALALTDRNALYGAVAFDKACHAAGIQPLIGLSLTVAAPTAAVPDTGQLLLLAKNRDGYRSLCHLSSYLQAHADRESRLARGVPWEIVTDYAAGLIALDAGQQGLAYRWLSNGRVEMATTYLQQLAHLWGNDGYIGLEWHTPDEQPLLHELVALGEQIGLAAVAAQPVYTLNKSDQPLLRLLKAIDHNCLLEEVPAEWLPAHGRTAATLHWQTPNERQAHFAAFPEALARTAVIAAQCEPCLPDGRPIWPVLPLGAQTADEALREQTERGLQQFYGDEVAVAVRTRLEHELQVIGSYGFAPLFLIVADIVRYARQHDIPVSTRGSVADSLVAFCLGISTVDPIAHDLLFERFLNPARANLPDIDLDFCSRRRDEVLAYVRQRYGEEQVALVATINTLQSKSAVREVGKAYGLAEEDIKRLSKQIKFGWHPDPRRREVQTVDDLLATTEKARERLVWRAAFQLIGQPHHLSVHPGGLVITPTALADTVPVQWTTKGFRVTQFDHSDVERIGLPKLDLLGIRALTVLADAAELVRQHHQPQFTLADIPTADEATAVLMTHGETIGVFQCESTGAQRTLRQLQVKNTQDLAIANAFFKPGPATGGMAQAFIRRYRGDERVSFLHPQLAPILQTTQGVLLFQEQILRIAREIAGLSWEDADHLRRGMSKFLAQEMAAMQEAFVTGCQTTSGFTRRQAQTLWEQVLAFAGYGFNQGHATAYADVSYRSAYIRAHWPAAFLAARLANGGGFHHPAIYMAEARRLGIAVRPPHVNHSGRKFTLAFEEENGDEQAVLWMGLSWIRALRRRAVREIVRQRPFASLRDLLSRVSLQKKEVQHLIQCGALDGLGESRTALLREAERIERSQPQQLALFATVNTVPPETKSQVVAWEKHILGFPVAVFPVEVAPSVKENITPLYLVPQRAGERLTIQAVRLPGWTGGRGAFVGDGSMFFVAGGSEAALKKLPRPWEVVVLTGRWQTDAWGGGWFQMEG